MSEEAQLEPVESPVIPVREGIELRLVDPNTSPEMFAIVQKNMERLKPFVAWAGEVYSEEDRFKGFMFQLDQFKAGTAYPMTIWAENKPIGMADIRDIGSELGAEIGYWIDEDYEGQGIVTQSLQNLIDFARSRHDISRINLNTMSDNDASKNVAERLGFELADSTVLDEGRFAGRTENHYIKIYANEQAS
jgi:RimJ/RimL family protein N-acetyltransferase